MRRSSVRLGLSRRQQKEMRSVSRDAGTCRVFLPLGALWSWSHWAVLSRRVR